MVKNPPVKYEPQETLLQSLGQVDPLKEGTETHSNILVWRIPWTEEPSRATVHRVAKSWSNLAHTQAGM